MAWDKRGARKGEKRTPERLRQKVISRDRKQGRGCYFSTPGICIGIDQPKVEVHHKVDAEDGGKTIMSNLATACSPCHTRHSAQVSQKRSVAKQNEWKQPRYPHHPGVIP